MNYFAPKSAAERYAKGRPYAHPQVVSRIKSYLSLQEPVSRALDVGCGTGLSTTTLKEIARHIVGVDISAEMLAQAPADPCIAYLVASAENLAVNDNAFDLLTVSSAFHWLNRSTFFAEARRVLRSLGWLIIYDNSFTGRMEEVPAFQTWMSQVYLKRYPSPPRDRSPFDAADAEGQGFHFVGQEQYQNQVRFSVATLVDYLVTQSNVIAAVEGGSEHIDDVREWLTGHIRPIFGDRGEATFRFHGPIWYLRKAL